jgi:hypothetical protein
MFGIDVKCKALKFYDRLPLMLPACCGHKNSSWSARAVAKQRAYGFDVNAHFQQPRRIAVPEGMKMHALQPQSLRHIFAVLLNQPGIGGFFFVPNRKAS